MKFVKRDEIVDVVIWNKHGDHEKVKKVSTYYPEVWECSYCSMPREEHGCIYVKPKDVQICPGDYIVKIVGNSYNPYKYIPYHKEEFKRLYCKFKKE